MTATSLHKIRSGKVRDLYDAGEGRLVIVASDRVSAFDVVMAEPVPDKGRVLTAMSVFWFGALADLGPSHLLDTWIDGAPEQWLGRMMLVRRAEMLPLECIVRGYLAGSAWIEYRARGTVHGMPLPPGLREADQLPEPIFTPSTKGEVGEHDENLSWDQAVDRVGRELAVAARDLCLAWYSAGAARAAERGVIVADTKFELGLLDGRLVVADEVLTPDSSRFWPADQWQPGRTPPSFDKQPLRDELEASGWDKKPPPPVLSPATIAATRSRYIDAYERISGLALRDWPGSAGGRASMSR